MKTYIRYLGIALSLIFTLALSGCASPVFNARVTTFQNWPDTQLQDPMTFEFSQDTEKEKTLEQTTYENLAAPALEEAGFTPTAPGQHARYIVLVSANAKQESRQVSTPVYYYTQQPVFNYGYYTHDYRWVGPYWDYVPIQQYAGDRISTEYYLKAQLTINIRDRQQLNAQKQPSSVYKTTAVTLSSKQSLLQLIPLLAQAAMSDFPAPNGSERTIQLELPKND